MINLYSSTRRKQIASLLLAAMGINILVPSVSYALTGGPTQPEFSSFEPVTTNQMVDEFTGDFTYNLPVLNVPGPAGSDYPLSLSYHSGAAPEEEASWVGYGWTLNPGAITRNTRGFPDDYDGATVKYWNRAPKNWTATVGTSASTEIFGKDLGVSGSASLRYNSYQGYGYNVGIGIPLGKGIASLGYNITDGKGSFAASVNPAAILAQTKAKAKKYDNQSKDRYNLRPYGGQGKPAHATQGSSISVLGGNFGLLSYSEAVRANHVSSYSGAAFNISANLQLNFLPAPIGHTININGSYSYQTNEESKNAPVYGYMYTRNAYGTNSNNTVGRRNENAVEDYYVEKDTPYNKRDTYLGVPINNADQFSASGEGIGGSFRLYHQQVGEFTPNYASSSIVIGNLSPEISAGLTFGGGTDIGAGLQQLTEGAWQSSQLPFSAPNGGENSFFRFTNDLGGTWAATSHDSDEPSPASVNRSGSNTSNLPFTYPSTRGGRSSYVAYHTKGDVAGAGSRRFSQRPSDGSLPLYNDALSSSAICEMSVVTATGTRYIYGLPLLNKNEKNLHYSVVNEPSNNVKSNYLVYTSKSDAQMSAISGEERDAAYAGSFLLTETHTPDYIDRTFNGPTQDDFGGYTRFNYKKQYGGSGTWYNWRTPYKGLLYQPNSLSDPLDDIGTMSCGQKEVAILQSIQTKTHTAIFVLGDVTRKDGFDAKIGDASGIPTYSSPGLGTGLARNPNSSVGTGVNGIKYLDRIELYSNEDIHIGPDDYPVKNVRAVPIKTVRFEYYSQNATETLCKGAFNSTSGNGKLTLKRVWFEYQGINTQISPYSFGYSYPSSAQYPDKYKIGTDDVTGGFGSTAMQNNQNPDYSPFDLDAWGNYQRNGINRFAKQQSWISQKPDDIFDPAAWQLKVIKLPTGGEIHVQYEQDDYAYVQDKPAHVMVPLVNTASEEDKPNDFVIDLNEIGITTAGDALATQQAVEREYKSRPGHKIYFKFLYSLLGNIAPLLDPITCNSEYITGYATVESTTVVGTNLMIHLATGSNGDYRLPQQVCRNFASTQRNGKLNPPGVCDPSVNGISDQGFGPAGLMRYILQRFGSIVGLNSSNSCAKLSPANSYFRIPVIKAKKGGGLRVKRLMTFDTGYDGEGVLYGSEYIYQMNEPKTGRLISSGVATTEPSGQREENILVDFMPRENQDLWSKIVAGEDMKQAEGPLGEGLLPAPLVGYARVVTRNIHSGLTSTGYAVSEFATARKYPMQVKKTDIDSDTQYRVLTAGLVTDQVNNLYADQGFSFILNNMHGQPTRKATYPGKYDSSSEAAEQKQTVAASSEQVFTYYEPGKFDANSNLVQAEAITVVSPEGVTDPQAHPGREVDLTIAQRSVKDTMYDLNFETDVDVTFLFFFTLGYFTIFPTLSRSSSEFCTHATSKVVRYPAILKKVTTLQDGIVHTSENLAFDQSTGQPVLVQTNDEFSGGYLQQTQMASWIHPRLGSKAATEGVELSSSSGSIGSVSASNKIAYLTLTGQACDGIGKLTRGDLIELTSPTAGNPLSGLVFHVDQPDLVANRVRVYPVVLPYQGSNSFPTALTSSGVSVSRMRILSSGRTNQLATVAGNTTFHNTSLTARTVPTLSTPVYGASDDFTTALNDALKTNINPGATPVLYSLPGSFESMNISAFANLIPAESGIDPSSAKIKNVKLYAFVDATGQRRILFDQFDIDRGNDPPVHIQNP